MDGLTIQAVDAAMNIGLPHDAAVMLMVESDAGGAAALAGLDQVEAACRAAGASDLLRAQDVTEADWLRAARRQAHPSLDRLGGARMDDVGVPRARVADLLEAIERIGTDAHMRIGVWARR